MIFQKLPTIGNPHNPMQLLVDFSQHLLQLWKRCYDEKYFPPIKDLCALLAFTFQLHIMSVAPPLIAYLLPIAQDTMYIIADRRYRSVNGELGSDPESIALAQSINTTQILTLVYTTALACATTTSSQPEAAGSAPRMDFWRLMALDTVQLFLTQKQPLDDILGMLRLLCTSVFPTSIGPVSESRDAAAVARIIIEKVSRLLVDLPRSATSWREKHAARTAALEALTAFLRSPFGATQLALHPNLIPRLITVLSSSLDELYEVDNIEFKNTKSSTEVLISRLSLESDGGDSDEGEEPIADPRQDIAGTNRIIAQAMFLLHRLVTDPRTADVASVNEKLSASQGGSQRYILALARLNFAGDMVLEEGIDEETIELAHELLELAVTPDEAEAISEAFGADDG